MKHKIYFSVCGEGYGHYSRDLAIAKVLRRNGAHVLMGGMGMCWSACGKILIVSKSGVN